MKVPEGADLEEYIWKVVSGNELCDVQYGVVTAKAPGTATILGINMKNGQHRIITVNIV